MLYSHSSSTPWCASRTVWGWSGKSRWSCCSCMAAMHDHPIITRSELSFHREDMSAGHLLCWPPTAAVCGYKMLASLINCCLPDPLWSRVAEQTYDKSQLMHWVLRNWKTNTYKILALLQYNSITQEYTIHPLFVANLALTILTTFLHHSSTMFMQWMAWQERRALFIGQEGTMRLWQVSPILEIF